MRGFHLIEILIVLSILGILYAASLPVYTSYVMKARRFEAIQMLAKLSVKMENYFIEHNTYKNATLSKLHSSYAINSYQFVIQKALDNDYLLAAIPRGTQTKDLCGTLTLDAQGRKHAKREPKDCWS